MVSGLFLTAGGKSTRFGHHLYVNSYGSHGFISQKLFQTLKIFPLKQLKFNFSHKKKKIKNKRHVSSNQNTVRSDTGTSSDLTFVRLDQSRTPELKGKE